MVPKASFGVLGVLALASGVASGREGIQPEHEYAKERAHMVFNAIHSAGREWGSALYHNGFGFFPATVPEGTIFYHGSRQNVTPTGPEWLAFDIEHAENFARSFKYRPGGRHPGAPPGPPPGKKKPDADKGQTGENEDRQELRRRSEYIKTGTGNDPLDKVADTKGDDDPVVVRGYFHTYQTNRDLKVLVIDGMSAGKTDMGTLDSQDLVLRENNTNRGSMDEWNRANDLCKLASEWGIDGFVRIEIGIEIIKCDFGESLDLVSMMRTELMDRILGKSGLATFQFVRAVGERYDGVGANRLRIDFSSMVSGLFFPINISSTVVGRPDLKRLGSATLEELKDVKAYLDNVLRQPRRFIVDWQGVTDLIMARYSKRLALMVHEPLQSQYFIDEVEAATLTWYNAPPSPDDNSMADQREVNRTADAIEQCRVHYLRPALKARQQWSFEDELIYTSLDAVLGTICQTLFLVRNALLEASGSDLDEYRIRLDNENDTEMEKAISSGRAVIRALMSDLGWSTWKKPQPCQPDEVNTIAMWPFGTKEDHWHPGCRSIETVQQPGDRYWWNRRPRKV
ncbi:uncharacterized protein FPRO_12884 [Fusarium proliferatum ET1]|uniref:Uncharacterized protein n=1 Tax=Fusarium proliferatum (strain ET1) TaxID=1227346 RepID=A0A1L7W6Q3_FUSPR|nr:uncharacterized protein FPRO_12884 [Fusarium proliferatum ET1]CZR48274.1 uncharacterized protein FPRO_12884 [Fusarium proliferatum ET1]